jgi:hypothetical protein
MIRVHSVSQSLVTPFDGALGAYEPERPVFACTAQGCMPRNRKARLMIARVQQLLNLVPSDIIDKYPGGRPVPVDGVLGAGTLAALRVFSDATRRALGQDPIVDEHWTPSWVSGELGDFIMKFPRLLGILSGRSAAGVSLSGGLMGAWALGNGVPAGKPSAASLIRKIQQGLRATGVAETMHTPIDGMLGRRTVMALNAYLRATARAPMTSPEIVKNLPRLAEELDVQGQFTFEG